MQPEDDSAEQAESVSGAAQQPADAADVVEAAPHAVELELLADAVDVDTEPDEVESERDAPRGAASNPVPSASVLAAALVMPSVCACCADVASESRRLELGAAPWVVIVPLCDRCLTHEAVDRTRSLSVILAALLLGVASAVGLPLALERLSEGGLVQLSATSWFSRWGLFVLPCGLVLALVLGRALGWHWSSRRRHARCAPGPALAWRQLSGEGRRVAVLRCAQPSFAAQLLALNPARLRLGDGSPRGAWDATLPRLAPQGMVGVVVVTLLVSVGSFVIHRPRVQVLNLTEHPLALEVDGEIVAQVPVTSQESANAGVELRLPAGRRHLRALSEGQVVAEADVTLRGATRHLYAPASAAHCFWLERTSYGRGNTPEPAPGSVERLPLTSPLRFWAFPQAPDIWLAPPPEPLLDDARSSGGEVTALRQARCTDAPADARP